MLAAFMLTRNVTPSRPPIDMMPEPPMSSTPSNGRLPSRKASRRFRKIAIASAAAAQGAPMAGETNMVKTDNASKAPAMAVRILSEALIRSRVACAAEADVFAAGVGARVLAAGRHQSRRRIIAAATADHFLLALGGAVRIVSVVSTEAFRV